MDELRKLAEEEGWDKEEEETGETKEEVLGEMVDAKPLPTVTDHFPFVEGRFYILVDLSERFPSSQGMHREDLNTYHVLEFETEADRKAFAPPSEDMIVLPLKQAVDQSWCFEDLKKVPSGLLVIVRKSF